jgi:NAD(P)-dependent dehydrogenase (short-subunit alcohol dehydrogenase family)
LSRILVVGGYGGFGGRLSRRLVDAGHDVMVGGRSLKRAEAYCREIRGCSPVQIDRQRDAQQILARERPDILIDAAGPFQRSGYELPEACISAGVHYLDLADDRDFVSGIGRLDGEARRKDVVIISGASSVPCLSQAVVAELRNGLDRITAVEIAISASSRASAGNSVAAAILSGVGQPLKLWQGRRWVSKRGWQSVRRERLELPSGKSIGTRTLALADVPDQELLPVRLPGVSAVSFRAGTESRAAVLTLWLASLLVQCGAVRSMIWARRVMVPLHRATAIWGSDRSGMLIRMLGTAGRRRLERRWTLIAEEGDGPEIPVLAAAILADRVDRLPPGAVDAGGLLTLADFDPHLSGLSVEHQMVEVAQPEPLYRRVMGAQFDRLPPAVKAVHDVLRDHGAAGAATVKRGSNWLARIVARIMRFPPAGEHPLHVHFEERDGVERWTRDFGGYRFSSRLRAAGQGGQIIEAFGPLRFKFELKAESGGLQMNMTGWSLGSIPLPRFLAPRSDAREWEEEGRFYFDVPIALPLIGPVVHYRGWLKP